jgi:very-short-patch-repair endonuclease
MADQNGILGKLASARRDLLDLTGRNRLLHTPRSSTRSGRLEIVDEISDEVFRILVREKKAMVFSPDTSIQEEDGETGLLSQPDDDEDGVASRHRDTRLQTRLISEALQRKLLKLYYDARTFEEEQGVNILYLALGFLKWYEDDKSDRERHAPLLLIPVELDRQSVASRFRLRYTDEDVTTNLSLQEKLKVDFGVQLPDVPDVDDLSPTDYYAQVRQAVFPQPRWELLPNDMVLWFFSFSKFLMYRDLQPDTWPPERQIDQHGLVQSLLKSGFANEPAICSENGSIDDVLQPLDMIHIMDADSSQSLVIEEARRGRSLVVQGPPGTGKSQTIGNLIATAVKEGKKVLFVAEKMAALEVVKRRLDNIGLGDVCLELHSHKANKRAVLDELARTLSLGRPRIDDVKRQAGELKSVRDRLNRHAAILHSYLDPTSVTPFQALGELVRLRNAGIRPAEFELVDALTWTSTDLQEKRSMLQDLAIQMQEIGNPTHHPWRGVQLESVLPMDLDRIRSVIPGIIERVDRVISAMVDLARILQQEKSETALDASRIGQFGQFVTKAPAMDRQGIGNAAWQHERCEIDELLETGKQFAECQQALQNVVVDAGWTTDVSGTRRDLAAYGSSLFRILNRRYRDARATLRGILADAPPQSLCDRLQILDRLIQGQKCLQKLEGETYGQQLGRRVFGNKWRGPDSNWSELEEIARWEADCRGANAPADFLRVFSEIEADAATVHDLVTRIAKDLRPLMTELQDLFKQLDLDLAMAFGIRDLRTIPLPELRNRLKGWESQTEAITKWIAYFVRWRRLEQHGMGGLAKLLDEGVIAAMDALDRFQMCYYEDLMREAFRRYPELATFDGVSHEQLLARFRDLDLERLRLARQEVAWAHFQGLPAHGGDAGEVGIVRREIKKKRRLLPLRKLLQQAGHAVQATKPVFMMSPNSVAQYLEPGVLEFDLLLIDEASQVRPVEALGAIARAKQLVVVGDDRQLPPTRFFSRVVGEEGDATEVDDFQAGDLESILGLCEAQNMPQRMLQWHYRSRHHSLIAVSNREFYDDNLFVVPSPFGEFGSLGLKLRHVASGVFDRGGSATNRVEATAVADAVMEHARQYPDKTLGVGAFSVAQRDAIIDELEMRRRGSPELEPFFATAAAEPFFAKNLENIQGDERDVIFISVGYGRNASGYMAMSFGPLNNDGGERRLNVLITRARERCEVFSSITADDIDLGRTQARGSRALKTFLTYAKTGFLDVPTTNGRGCDSEFEREVAKAIVRHGYNVDTQVGVAGFFVDLAIVDPACPGRYLLGIECDGATYHSSRSARDRDRLRQQVLEDRGWIIYRIWSTDWFHRPDEQLRKVLAAVENSKAVWASRAASGSASPPRSIHKHPDAVNRVEGNASDEVLASLVMTSPYIEAHFSIDDSYEIHELDVDELAGIVARIVEIEGPVHQDEIARRVASLWGLKRTGCRIGDAVDAALSEATYQGHIEQTGPFFRPTGQQAVPVRNRSMVESSNLRKSDYLPPAEVQAALLVVIRAHMGMSTDEAAAEMSRLFGFKATSAQLRQIAKSEIRLLLEEEVLEQRNGKLYAVAKPASSCA